MAVVPPENRRLRATGACVPAHGTSDALSVENTLLLRTGRSGGFLLRIRATAALITLCLVALCLLGCGGGLAFDGGSFPPGGGSSGGSRVTGIAFYAENTKSVVANATVSISALPIGGTRYYFQTTTAKNGAFDLGNIPTGTTSSQVTVTITPEANSDRQSQKVAFTLPYGHSKEILFALPAITFDQTQVASVSVSVPQSEISNIGQEPITALVLDQAGHVLPVTPSLVHDPAYGAITLDGYFVSNHNANGVSDLVAFWYTGVTQLTSTATIDVNPNIIDSPPPPPITGTYTQTQARNTTAAPVQTALRAP